MTITVAPCTSVDEGIAALGPIWHYFGRLPSPEDATRFTSLMPIDRMLSARENNSVVGGAGSFPFEMTVPGGGSVRAAGTTVVGVAPTHRRRGILRSLMRAQLDDIHGRGEPIAYLWASEETIYGRFGYGLASWAMDVTIPKPGPFQQAFAPRANIRLISGDEAVEPLAEIYERALPENPGMFRRTREWWTARRLADPEHRRAGGGLLNRAVLYLEERPAAYALYRVNQHLDGGVTTGHVLVLEAVATSPESTRELWRFLLDIDWVTEVRAVLLPVDHPLLLHLGRPRVAKPRMVDALWVRLVDVAKAIRARRLGQGDPVVIDVKDAFCPWNEGRYRIGPESVERSTSGAEISLDVTALGSVYLGGLSFRQLHQAERVVEHTSGALDRADALFRTDRAPWCPEVF